ncbi:MAG: hypothetical protein K5945_06940 [Bacteroidaceae bacterium]|nr:hypothetical protein [Bacteroidaceae bacterium]
MALDSVLDLNSNNVWTLNEFQIADLWEAEKADGDFTTSEAKLLNTIRLAFEVVHYNEEDPREKARFEGSEWAHLTHNRPGFGTVALRRKNITRITDLSYENVRHITAATLLELIDRNFGGGWESISLQIRDIIESGFDVSTIQLPASRIHQPGGTLEHKVLQGYEVLEITKGTWVEAIFAKKKDPIEKLHFESPFYKDETEDNMGDEDAEDIDDRDDRDEDEDEETDDESFYSNYSAEAEVKNEDEEGFPVEE